jgi:cold shock protein
MSRNLRTGTCGTVKWFDAARGFGAIERDDGWTDCSVDTEDVVREGLFLAAGDRVEFDVVESTMGPVAQNVRRFPRFIH